MDRKQLLGPRSCQSILRFVEKELAEYQKLPGPPRINEEILERDGFDVDPSPFMAYVVEDKKNQGALIGHVICNVGYATWLGKRLYIEDFMITEKYRGMGIGSKLFSFVCKEALKIGCVVINFVMVDWNPAGKFYAKMGAKNITKTIGWRFNVMTIDAIEKAAMLYDRPTPA